MKGFILMVCVFSALMIFFGCSEDNTTAPELNRTNQITPSIAKLKTMFSGTSTKVEVLSQGNFTTLPNGKALLKGWISVYADTIDDPRVSGISTWYVNALINPDGSEYDWGKAQLIVDNNGSKWEMTWHGRVSPEGRIVDYVTGTGKEGAVKGLIAKWTYIREPGQAGFYSVQGIINNK